MPKHDQLSVNNGYVKYIKAITRWLPIEVPARANATGEVETYDIFYIRTEGLAGPQPMCFYYAVGLS